MLLERGGTECPKLLQQTGQGANQASGTIKELGWEQFLAVAKMGCCYAKVQYSHHPVAGGESTLVLSPDSCWPSGLMPICLVLQTEPAY
ncbi:unnamed protein product [Caretta caretta]